MISPYKNDFDRHKLASSIANQEDEKIFHARKSG